ncbi:high choriolytic enzyme 2-like isoform X1 [Leuresthes tenuis]|uniref:high choriolytic enzyme 2-like isoform X1 n=1 Tax=Leuresthes tenuis TaxID=355514 RepID=UPI003B5145EC
MIPSASLLLLLLLGLSKAQPFEEEISQYEDQEEDQDEDQEEYQDKDQEENQEEDQEEDQDDVDITDGILTTNNGTDGFLWEGDLVAPTTRNAMTCWSNSCLWRKASNRKVMIPYVVSRQFPKHEKRKIQKAMKAFKGRTCIRFTPRRRENDFISIVNKQGCYSALGRQGGRQELSLNRGGCMYSGIIQHELIHALGFQHEQTRSDRDKHVRINWGNIIQQSAYNFKKHNTNNLNTPYDYSSIMHYGKTAFSIGYGKDSITPIPNRNVPIGQRRGMSRWDIKRINLLYKC